MLWFRMVMVAWRLTWPFPLTPWRSPLLRWRIETYGVLDTQGHPLHADQLTRAHVLTFIRRHLRALTRFLRWAALL